MRTKRPRWFSGFTRLDDRGDLGRRRGRQRTGLLPARLDRQPAARPALRFPQVARPLVAARQLVSPDHDQEIARRFSLRMMAPPASGETGLLKKATRPTPSLAHVIPLSDPPHSGSPGANHDPGSVSFASDPTSGERRHLAVKIVSLARCDSILSSVTRVVYLTPRQPSSAAGGKVPLRLVPRGVDERRSLRSADTPSGRSSAS